jgi:threonine synthase
MDPHGAVGYLGLKEYQKSKPHTYGIFLETAHPVKFLDVVEETLGLSPEIPAQIQKVMGKEKHSIKIKTYEDLKDYLQGN